MAGRSGVGWFARQSVTTRTSRSRRARTRVTITAMRRTLATTAAVLATLMLAGCSDAGPSADDKKYADAVAAADPADFGGIPTDKLADTLSGEGPDLCKQLEASYESAIAYARTGFSAKEAAALVVGAVLVYCPERKDLLP